MSTHKAEIKRITTHQLREMKNRGEKIAMLTAYDYSMAKIIDGAGIDIILVGDSASNVMAGHETTLPITLDQMIYHAASVVRAVKRSLVVVVPLSNKDIGYLPGDIKSKVNPYMEPLWDNLKFIQNQYHETDKEYSKITEMVNQEKLVITPLAYIRGRSLSNICFIVDEAQNLTPHEVKTIITRAGENTKIIFTGDIYQIDTPYLDSQSNGLSTLIDRLKDNELYAHITLEKGERSELANLANLLL